jgi:hypothetical protein
MRGILVARCTEQRCARCRVKNKAYGVKFRYKDLLLGRRFLGENILGFYFTQDIDNRNAALVIEKWSCEEKFVVIEEFLDVLAMIAQSLFTHTFARNPLGAAFEDDRKVLAGVRAHVVLFKPVACPPAVSPYWAIDYRAIEELYRISRICSM